MKWMDEELGARFKKEILLIIISLLVSKIENDVAVVGKAKIRIRGSMHEVVESD